MKIPPDSVAHLRYGRGLIAGLLVGFCLAATATAEPLTLNDALMRAGANDPAQMAGQRRVDAAEAAARQAGVKPNPSLAMDVENFGGSGRYGMLDRSEITIYYEQTWERGGKRQAREDAALAEIEIARLHVVTTKLDLYHTVGTLWIEAQAAQAEVTLAEARLNTALQSQAEVKRRVDAARDPLFAGTAAQTDVAQARIALDMAKSKALETRRRQAAFWDGAPEFEPEFEIDMTGFSVTDLPPTVETLPVPVDLQLWERKRAAADARLRVEQTRATNDVTWRGGVRHFGEDGDVALMVGGSIPLGLNNTNKGNIDRAAAERSAIEADSDGARLTYQRSRARLLANMAATAQERQRLEAEVIPLAERTLAQVREGYARGGFRHSDVIDAMRILDGLKVRHIDLLSRFHLDRAALNRLDGRYAQPVLTDGGQS